MNNMFANYCTQKYTKGTVPSVYFCVHILSYSTSFTKRTACPLQR